MMALQICILLLSCTNFCLTEIPRLEFLRDGGGSDGWVFQVPGDLAPSIHKDIFSLSCFHFFVISVLISSVPSIHFDLAPGAY